jgi:arginine exporter protein ArgO
MNPSRIKEIFYSVVSICFGILFFFLAFVSWTGFGLLISYSEPWEIIVFVLTGSFLFLGGAYVLVKTLGSKQEGLRDQAQDKSAWKDILQMLVLICILIAAVWAMFHFGLQ